jgi:SRSO17 transposase
MDAKSLRELRPELDLFIDRYLPQFGREGNHQHATAFLHGLLAGGDRRNVENIAEAIDGPPVRTLQKFIAQSAWDDSQVLGELRRHIIEVLGEEDGILVADETGFPKKGTKSVGVQRQYSGILGRVDNCQIGVFLNYCSAHGHCLYDRRLFLPQSWTEDPERCHEAGVPNGTVFRTKPELALSMIEAAVRTQTPFRWVAGDSVYGDSPVFLQGVRALGKLYVMDVSESAHVWLENPAVTENSTGRGRPKSRPQSRPCSVASVVATLPDSAWRRVVVAEGSQGPRTYEYAELIVWFSEERLPAQQPERLLIRRSLEQQPQVKYQRSNAPAKIPLQTLAGVAGCRWTVEQDFQCGKGECGLDEYETRGWVGWHHHTALSMLALWFLALQKRRLGEKTSSDHGPRATRRTANVSANASLGRGNDHRVVAMETRKKSHRRRVPSPAKGKTPQAMSE